MAKNYQFKIDNEAAIEMVTSEGYVRNIIMHNYGADRQQLLDEEDLAGKAIEPNLDYAAKTIHNAKLAKQTQA